MRHVETKRKRVCLIDPCRIKKEFLASLNGTGRVRAPLAAPKEVRVARAVPANQCESVWNGPPKIAASQGAPQRLNSPPHSSLLIEE